ncbi:MAG: DNA translocase FtsK, partial [Porphyromonas sp.]|nr:DNA translocase FtsK [Porphyromonas sp.]
IIFICLTGLRILRSSKGGYIRLFFLCGSAMFWSMLLLGLLGSVAFPDQFFLLGGLFGKKLAEYSILQIGYPGTILVLVFFLFAILLIFFQSFTPKVKGWFAISNKEPVDSLPVVPEEVKDRKGFFSLFKKKKRKEDDSDASTDESEDIAVATDLYPNADVGAVGEQVETYTSEDKDEVDLEILRPQSDSLEDNNLAQSLLNELGEYDPHIELSHFKMPSIELLDDRREDEKTVDLDEIEDNKRRITATLESFQVSIVSIRATVGPTVTLYEVVPADGVRISRIKNLEDDIALSLSALGIRIIAPIPGKGTIGIEVANRNPKTVSFRSVLSSQKFLEKKYELPVALGRTITNEVFSFDLAKIPHLLVAGATGQGKSVGLNVIILSLLYSKHPSELKFVMVDPKMVEFSIFSMIQNHYMAKLEDEKQIIITDTGRVVSTLNSLCKEMDDRYELLTKAGVKNIVEYNHKFKRRLLSPTNGYRFMPYIVLVIDEYGDLIMTAGKEIELPLARIAQKARAVGIHAIIATQRPTASIITGTIKANFPGRISFKVYSSIDSRTILDTSGANRLIGRGDLLYSQGNEATRVQCAYVDTEEINRVVDYISSQQGYAHPYFLPDVSDNGSSGGRGEYGGDADSGSRDALFEEAATLMLLEQSGSTSLLQRRFSIGFARAGRLMDQLEQAGVVGPSEGSKPRQVFVQSEEDLRRILDRS